jgi:hypothetical protein
MNASARLRTLSARPWWVTSSTSGIWSTGLKKWMPQKRVGWLRPSCSDSMRIDDVLVARIASSRIPASQARYTACLISRSSGTASMTRSARRKPSPCGSGISRSSAARRSASENRRLANMALARLIAGPMNSIPRSCKLT